MSKVVTISSEFADEIVEYLRFQLDYHVFESSEPECYGNEVSVELTLLELLGEQKDARSYAAKYMQSIDQNFTDECLKRIKLLASQDER